MDILTIIKNRRSIRSYSNIPIPKEIIDKLIEALIWAPSAGNLQSRKFYFVFNNEVKQKLAHATSQCFIAEAPLVVIDCTDNSRQRYGERGENLYSICDVSASIQNMMLLAYSEGLGSCWIGAFKERRIIEILNLPSNLRPIAIVPVGYSDIKQKISSRISKEEAVIEIK